MKICFQLLIKALLETPFNHVVQTNCGPSSVISGTTCCSWTRVEEDKEMLICVNCLIKAGSISVCGTRVFVLCEILARDPSKPACEMWTLFYCYCILQPAGLGAFACESYRKRGRRLNGNKEHYSLLVMFHSC